MSDQLKTRISKKIGKHYACEIAFKIDYLTTVYFIIRKDGEIIYKERLAGTSTEYLKHDSSHYRNIKTVADVEKFIAEKYDYEKVNDDNLAKFRSDVLFKNLRNKIYIIIYKANGEIIQEKIMATQGDAIRALNEFHYGKPKMLPIRFNDIFKEVKVNESGEIQLMSDAYIDKEKAVSLCDSSSLFSFLKKVKDKAEEEGLRFGNKSISEDGESTLISNTDDNFTNAKFIPKMTEEIYKKIVALKDQLASVQKSISIIKNECRTLENSKNDIGYLETTKIISEIGREVNSNCAKIEYYFYKVIME